MIETKHGRSNRLIFCALGAQVVGAALALSGGGSSHEMGSETPIAADKGWTDAHILAAASFGVGFGLGVGASAVRAEEDDLGAGANGPDIKP